jgi:hypothetical protein
MRYALQNPDGSFTIDLLGRLFPNISFAGGVPGDAWLAANHAYPVVDSLSVDAYSRCVAIEPTLKDGVVFAVQVQPVPLDSARSYQMALLQEAYQSEVEQPVAFTSEGGVAATYQVDQQSVASLSQMMLAFQVTQTVPDGFSWVAADNTSVPFTYADLQGLAQAIGARSAAAFATLQTLKSQVREASSVDDVRLIVWPT